MTFPSADFGSHTIAASDLTRWQGQPLIAFLGVATEGSFIYDVFPAWADVLGTDWALRGVDLPLTTGPAAYRSFLTALHTTTAIAGAVVTSHKLPVYATGRDLFVGTDLFATVAREVNAISSSLGLRGYARDPLSLTLILSSVVDPAPPRVVCFGAGGAATALLIAYATDAEKSEFQRRLLPRVTRPHMTFIDVKTDALVALQRVARHCDLSEDDVELIHTSDGRAIDAALFATAPGDLVINATGLGKQSSGSPLPDARLLTAGVTAWDLNYRGPLNFLTQASHAHAIAVDGWDYFVAGWAGALTAIASAPFSSALLRSFAAAAEPFRPVRPPNSQSFDRGNTKELM
jgi:shikimate dehydrogenase